MLRELFERLLAGRSMRSGAIMVGGFALSVSYPGWIEEFASCVSRIQAVDRPLGVATCASCHKAARSGLPARRILTGGGVLHMAKTKGEERPRLATPPATPLAYRTLAAWPLEAVTKGQEPALTTLQEIVCRIGRPADLRK